MRRLKKVPVRIHDDGPAQNHPGAGAVTAAVVKHAKTVIGELEFGMLSGPVGNINSWKTCRIDRQPHSSGGANIQVQLNDWDGHSTVATCVIDGEVFQSIAPWPARLREHQEYWLTRQVRVALVESLEERQMRRITGSFNDPDPDAKKSNLTPRENDNYRISRPRDPAIQGSRDHEEGVSPRRSTRTK